MDDDAKMLPSSTGGGGGGGGGGAGTQDANIIGAQDAPPRRGVLRDCVYLNVFDVVSVI